VRPRAVLFDAVGTLIELREPVGTTYAREALAFGVDLPAWRVDDAFRRVHAGAGPMTFPGASRERVAVLEKQWWQNVVRSTFLATDGTARFRDFDGYFERLWSRYAGVEAWRLRAGAGAALHAIRTAGALTGVASNFDQRLPGLLEALEIAMLLDLVWTPADCGAQKPAPAFFRGALAALGTSADDAVYVGDDPEADLEGARAAGLVAIDVGKLATLDELPRTLSAMEEPGR